MPLAPKTYTFLCGCFAALGSILFGYDLGVIAGVLPASDFLRVSDLTNDPHGNWIGFISSSLLLGAFCGCVPASLIADRFSRRTAIFHGGLWFMVGGALQAAAQNRGMMLAGRFIAGFAIGQLSFLAPLYQAEIAHPTNRGALTTLQQLFLGIGALIASFIVYALQRTQDGTAMQWRLPLGLQLFPCVPLVAMIYLFPESPRWLMSVGREEEAIRSLARLHARGDITDAFVLGEAAEIKAEIQFEKEVEQGWKRVFGDASNLRRVFLGIMLQFSVQMTGVSCIQYYAPQIFASIGFSNEKTFLFQCINSIIALIAQTLCVMFCDRIGFRPLLIGANLVSCATFAVGTAIQAKFPASVGNTSAGYAFVIMTWIFNFAFSIGIGPVSWAIPPAIMPTGIRSKGTAVTSMAAWIANFMIGQVSPVAFERVGWRYYVVFCICSFTNAIAMWALMPETNKGKTLEEMDAYLRDNSWFIPANKNQEHFHDRAQEIREGHHTAPAADVLYAGEKPQEAMVEKA